VTLSENLWWNSWCIFWKTL